MFLASLNLALLSLCYFGSNNQILDTGNMDTPLYNAEYDIYEISFGQEAGVTYLLRYDDVTLFEFTNDISSEYNVRVSYNVSISQRFNFSVHIKLNDEGFLNFPQVSDTFDCLHMFSSSQSSFNVWGYDYTLQTGDYADDSQPSYKLYIRLLTRETYDYAVLGDDTQFALDNAYQQGYADGHIDGVNEGTAQAQEGSYQEGYRVGYNVGLAEGSSRGRFSFTNLFASIADTPILMIRRLFGFEIFGISVLAAFMSLFTAFIVIKVIKRLF